MIDMKVNGLPDGKAGPWTIDHFTIPDKPDIASIRYALQGRPVRPGTYTRLSHEDWGLVMTDTPAEQNDHRAFVAAAKGHVLINGLGIGMCIGAVLQKPEVTKVTVIEISQDLIDLVGPHYTKDPRVEIICFDAFEYLPPKGQRYGAVWSDIWPEISVDNLPEMARLNRKYGPRSDWNGCWCQYECGREKRRWG